MTQKKGTTSRLTNKWLTIYVPRFLNGFNIQVIKAKASAVERRASPALPGTQFGKAALPLVLPLALMLIATFSSVGAMQKMHDKELAEVSGQALMQMEKVLPGDKGTDINGPTFYKAGLDAVVELNMNIDKLQLGCTNTAVNGNFCDIDIDKLSLSGGTWGADGRPSSSAALTRPFFEFAIKNDQSKTLREIVGIRLSAEKASGMLTAGDQQPGESDPGNTSGINSLSGYMKLGPTSGVAETEARSLTYSDLNRRLTGRIFIDIWPVDDAYNFSSDEYNLNLASVGANVSVPTTVVSGKRLSSVNLLGSATIDPIPLSGDLSATITGLPIIGSLNLDKTVTGSVSGLTATVPIEQSLKFIHKINVNSPFSLSMQGADVLWPDASAVAEKGWWMAFEDEVSIGNISPEAKVPIDNSVLLQAVGPEFPSWEPNPYPTNEPLPPPCTSGPSINCTLTTGISTRTYTTDGGNYTWREIYGVECGGISGCLSGNLPLGNLTVPANLDFPLNNLKLSEQSIEPNCYGTARFC
ncbi:hypothetical protein [Alcanivorax jadensis]|uniref:hypothetical protein n=1 Tax=Alcanivorax jadensis TaxID=64988 RepID=UPI00240A72EF|nr:hypothetical protein [Alcanivorax jadensis]MDF1637848.1 hypothetical protein [Alcanivorax jadensis]